MKIFNYYLLLCVLLDRNLKKIFNEIVIDCHLSFLLLI